MKYEVNERMIRFANMDQPRLRCILCGLTLVLLVTVLSGHAFAQSASGTWALDSTSAGAGVISGNVAAQAESFSSLSVNNYQGPGTPKSQRVTIIGGSWPADANQVDSRYIQFALSPEAGSDLTVSSVALSLGASGGSNMKANLWYSSDSTFTSRTQLNGTAVSLSNGSLTALSYPISALVPNGRTFFVRIYPWYTSASTGKYICPQNLVITGNTAGASGTVTVSDTLLAGFGTTVAGQTSTSSSYTVSGSGLGSNLLVTAPAGFEVSTNNTAFSATLSLVPSGGVLPATTIYAHFVPATAVGNVSGVITHGASGATSATVVVSGVAIAGEPTTSSVLSFGSVTGTSIVVNFAGGNGNRHLLVARAALPVSWAPQDGSAATGVNSDFAVAQDQGSGNKVMYDGTGSTDTLVGLAPNTGYYAAVYEYNVGTGNSQNYLTSSVGTGSQTTLAVPAIVVAPGALSFGPVQANTTSAESTYTLSASYLVPASGNIAVSAPAGFEVSATTGTGFGSYFQLPYSAGTLAPVTVYVRFKPGSVGAYSGSIADSGGGAAIRYVTVAGQGVLPAGKQPYYVAATGSDTNPGTISQPFRSLAHAVAVAGPDSLIYVRGGIYSESSTENLSNNGSAGKYIKVWAYPGESPVFDFASESSSSDGISLSGTYIHLKGLQSIHAGHNGINISGHYNIVEACSFHDNNNSGVQMGSSSGTAYPRGNLLLNCDSYRNFDAPIGGNADGFAIKWNIGSGNILRGCRGWNNSDDGYDFWMADSTIEVDSCWAFRNGVNIWGSSSFDGNGNGFKVGGNFVATPHLLHNCVSFDNAGNTGRGFDENNNTAGQTLYNCTSFRNTADNYHFTNTVTLGQHVIKNCVSYLSTVNITSGTRQANSWQGLTVSSADFVSLDTSVATVSRNADGTIPTTGLFRLAQGSSLIDAGVDVGLPYYGSAPDLGAFESNYPLPIQLASFTAALVNGSAVRLDWRTLSEVNNYGYYIEKRIHGTEGWSGIENSFVAGHGTTNLPQIYTFTDSSATAGQWEYRLRQVDLDGTVHYSDPVRVVVLTGVKNSAPAKFMLEQNYPNPFNPSTVIRFSVEKTGRAILEVYSTLGQKVATVFNGVAEAGRYYSTTLNANNLAGGVYFYRLQSSNKSDVKKFVLVK